MKTTKILLGALRVSALVAVVLAFAASAQAQTVNVNFVRASDANSSAYTGLGASSDTGTFWNGITGPYGATSFTKSPGTLLTSEDTSSTVGFTITATGKLYTLDAIGAGTHSTFAVPLVNALLDAHNTSVNPGSFTIDGLTAGGTYNLFLYAQEGYDNQGGESFTVDSTTLTARNSGGHNPQAFIAGNNYVEFASLTADGSGDITGTFVDLTGIAGNPGWNGFQIQSVEVPEPSTLATMSLAGLALLVLRKRFKKQSV